KEILEFMHYINKVKPAAEINMITNSRIFSYPETVIRFKSIKNLKIITELYGSNAELHDEITESEGSYDQTFAGIKNLIEAGYYVEYRIVISKKNYNDIAKMAKMIAEYFSTVERVVIFPIDYVGNAFLNKKNVQVRYCDIVPFVENATDILNDSKIQTKYYHIPYCVLKKRFHRYVQKGMTVPERRVALAEVCKGCLHEEDCPRVWRTYLKTFGMNEFKAIKVT
ncbi:MAG: hypothetical protein KKF44_08115, partial [Nanoarchaeota archaeon]|nr:hypothetical protein [Nanoarchaeota archaeon]